MYIAYSVKRKEQQRHEELKSSYSLQHRQCDSDVTMVSPSLLRFALLVKAKSY